MPPLSAGASRSPPLCCTRAPRCPMNYLSAFAFRHEIFSLLPRELGGDQGEVKHTPWRVPGDGDSRG